MLDVDFDDLDLGSKRKPTEWVAVLPASAQQPRQRSSRYVQKQSRCSLLSVAWSTQQSSTYSKQCLEALPLFCSVYHVGSQRFYLFHIWSQANVKSPEDAASSQEATRGQASRRSQEAGHPYVHTCRQNAATGRVH